MENENKRFGAERASMRFDNIEFRWCNCNEQHEIVKWIQAEDGHEHCIMLAAFDDTDLREEPNLRWVGRRPLELTDAEYKNFLRCIRFGYDFFSGEI